MYKSADCPLAHKLPRKSLETTHNAKAVLEEVEEGVHLPAAGSAGVLRSQTTTMLPVQSIIKYQYLYYTQIFTFIKLNFIVNMFVKIEKPV